MMEVISPAGMFGAFGGEPPITSAMREIAQAFAKPDDWADKYGAEVDNDTFAMKPFCWCEKGDCPWCWDEEEHGKCAPNFHHKPSDLKVWWYKYIGRDMELSRDITPDEVAEMVADCIAARKAN